MRILVAEEKHETRYLAADTLEQWANSCLQLLRQRVRWGYIYDPRESKPYFPPFVMEWMHKDGTIVTDAEIAQMPEISAAKARPAKSGYEAVLRRHQQDIEQYLEILAVVENNDTSIVTVGRGRFERQEPKAWRILYERGDHEYERITLEDVEEYDSEGNRVQDA